MKATTSTMHKPSVCSLPPNIRLFSTGDLDACVSKVAIGKGCFGKCFAASFGPLRVCLKVFRSEPKYVCYFYSEIRILTEIVHENLPFLYGVCPELKILVLSLHSFGDEALSLSLHNALNGGSAFIQAITDADWKSILLGCVSAVSYLHSKQILHNDIKSDNIVIEKLPTKCRAVLIDLGKACFCKDAATYSLSPQQKIKYAKYHPHIAPEVCNGTTSQTCASDMFAFGRVFLQLVISKLCHVTVLLLYCTVLWQQSVKAANTRTVLKQSS